MSDLIRRLVWEDVSFGHVSGKKLWDRVDVEFPLGETLWVQAPLGAGASTFLRMLAGLLPPNQGRYWINDKSFYEEPFFALTALQQKIGYGFDEGGLLSNLTLEGNLLLPLRYHGLMSPKESLERVHHYLKEFGLEEGKDLRPALASSGMKRSCLLARALILEPELLLLDDPTRGLSPELVAKLKKLLHWHREQRSLRHLFIATDDEAFMRDLDPRVLELREKRIILHDRPRAHAGRKSA